MKQSHVSPKHSGTITTASIFVAYIYPSESFIKTIAKFHPGPTKSSRVNYNYMNKKN